MHYGFFLFTSLHILARTVYDLVLFKGPLAIKREGACASRFTVAFAKKSLTMVAP